MYIGLNPEKPKVGSIRRFRESLHDHDVYLRKYKTDGMLQLKVCHI